MNNTQTKTPELSADAWLFVENTPKGKDFAFSASRTGSHGEDGVVEYNHEGLTFYRYQSIEDFARHQLDGDSSVKHEESYVVGERDGNGQIVFFDKAYSEDELDLEDDGDAVYTLYRKANND